MGILGVAVRLVVSALVLLFVDFVVPGFAVAGFGGALLTAVAVAALGFVVETLFGRRISPRSRGLVGFVTAAVVIYLAQFLFPTRVSVTLLGALLAALVIGLVDAFVPTLLR
ncbi:MAG: phage holin family protein [Acetobacteraceae bacterium]|nr:phage holin family protein [Acetobacteraceae bacterium]